VPDTLHGETEEALRERAADALEHALGFVDAHGGELARMRARVVLRAVPVEQLTGEIASRQLPDGSFTGPLAEVSLASELDLCDPPVPEALRATLGALAVLAEARALHTGCVEAAVGWASRMQRADGSWGGEAATSDAGIFATGMLGGYLGRTRVARPEPLARAGAFLAGLWSPERVEGGAWSVLTAFAHFFSNVPQNAAHDLADELLQWCGRELERGFRSHRFEALAVMRTLLDIDAAAMPGATLDTQEVLERLLAEQASDGGFAELVPDGPVGRVGPTIDATRAILALCATLRG